VDTQPTLVRDAAISFLGAKDNVSLQGTLWFPLEGPLTKEVIKQVAEIYCQRAKVKGVSILPDDLMIANIFIAES
jgi:hypothetical protein